MANQGIGGYSGGKYWGSLAWKNKSAAAKRGGFTLDPGQRHRATRTDQFMKEFSDILKQWKKDVQPRRKPGTSI